jgi:hypothetical protein
VLSPLKSVTVVIDVFRACLLKTGITNAVLDSFLPTKEISDSLSGFIYLFLRGGGEDMTSG